MLGPDIQKVRRSEPIMKIAMPQNVDQQDVEHRLRDHKECLEDTALRLRSDHKWQANCPDVVAVVNIKRLVCKKRTEF